MFSISLEASEFSEVAVEIEALNAWFQMNDKPSIA